VKLKKTRSTYEISVVLYTNNEIAKNENRKATAITTPNKNKILRNKHNQESK
jgi:hypothetical protein